MTTPQAVFQAVAQAFGVTPNFYCAKMRTTALVDARFAAWHIIRTKNPRMAFAEIAKASGGRHHGSIMHGVHRADWLLTHDESFGERYRAALYSISQQTPNLTTIYT